MKLKLDENLGRMAVEILVRAGHDVATVPGESLSGAHDREVITVCRREGRCLVTLDLDFSNPFYFDPSEYSGIAVLRLPPKATAQDLRSAVQTFAAGLEHEAIAGKLWVVRSGRIRAFHPNDA